KEVEKGRFSVFANRELQVGQQLDVMTPQGGFTVEPVPANANNYVFYAAGSGITPVLSMVRSVLESEQNSNVYLYYGNRTAEETIFKADLDALANKYQNLKLTYILSREDTGDANTYGRIDETKCGFYFD